MGHGNGFLGSSGLTGVWGSGGKGRKVGGGRSVSERDCIGLVEDRVGGSKVGEFGREKILVTGEPTLVVEEETGCSPVNRVLFESSDFASRRDVKSGRSLKFAGSFRSVSGGRGSRDVAGGKGSDQRSRLSGDPGALEREFAVYKIEKEAELAQNESDLLKVRSDAYDKCAEFSNLQKILEEKLAQKIIEFQTCQSQKTKLQEDALNLHEILHQVE